MLSRTLNFNWEGRDFIIAIITINRLLYCK